jgi:DNA-binding NarL/FixJ family response regulator
MIKIYITEDHEMYLEGLALLLKKQPDIEITGTSLNAAGLLKALPLLDIDILLLDVHLPDMEEEVLIKEIRELRPDLKVIYLTLMRGTRYIHKLLKYRIQGYVLKNAPVDELYAAVKTVCDGGTYFSDEINIMAKDDFRDTLTVEDHKIDTILSKREIEVLRLVCMEFSNTEIAEQLFLSISTVETHRKNLISKLGVNNTVGLVKFALKNKLIR